MTALRVRLHPAFAAYLLSVCALSSMQTCVGFIISLAAHELGHAAAAYALHEPVERVELAPFGGVMICAPGRTLSKGLRGAALSAAGPLASYLLVVVASSAPAQRLLPATLIRPIVQCSWAMLLLNLVPALPLDGGGIVFSLGYYLFGVTSLTTLLCGLGALLGVCMLVMVVFGVWRLGILNLSLVMAGGYLTLCAIKSRDALLTQNLFAVIEERLRETDCCRKMTAYRVPGNTPVVALLPWLSRTRCSMFWVESDADALVPLDERAVCRAMLASPRMKAREAAQNFTSSR